MNEFWCGLDVSKKSVDAAMRNEKKSKHDCFKFANEAKSYQSLLDWAVKVAGPDRAVKFCMESTGDYGIELGLWLSEKGCCVSVVNPALVKYFGLGKGRVNKTDKADAQLIVDYATENKPEPWALDAPARRDLFRLNRRRQQLLKMEVAESNRMECPAAIGEVASSSIRATVKFLREQIDEINAEMLKLTQGDSELKESAELIVSITVLGQGSARQILAEMPHVDQSKSAKDWAAAAGGHPLRSQSGTSLEKSRMNRGGRGRLRGALWMPALKGIATMPELESLYKRLRERGRTHKQALVACVRKLLMIVYGVLKSKKPYEPRIPKGPTTAAPQPSPS